jgi:hypothetical protein
MPEQGQTNIVSRVFEAYKVNPLLTGMIGLLLSIICALGFYMMRNDDRIYAYIAMRDNREADLYDRLILMAQKCRETERDKANFPEPNFPSQITGGRAFKERAKP